MLLYWKVLTPTEPVPSGPVQHLKVWHGYFSWCSQTTVPGNRNNAMLQNLLPDTAYNITVEALYAEGPGGSLNGMGRTGEAAAVGSQRWTRQVVTRFRGTFRGWDVLEKWVRLHPPVFLLLPLGSSPDWSPTYVFHMYNERFFRIGLKHAVKACRVRQKVLCLADRGQRWAQ